MEAARLKKDAKFVAQAAATGQDPGAQRAVAGTSGKRPGTSGAFSGISGDDRRALWRAWLLGAVLISCINLVNVLTVRHDAPELGTLAPVIWEASSGLVSLVIFALPALVALWTARAAPPWWRAAPVHLAAAGLYSVLHVSGFVALRKAAYPLLLHEPYQFGPLSSEFPYELRKDLLAYGLASIIFSLALRRSGRQAIVVDPAPAAPATFDIQDGAKLTRVPVGEILAVRSAGNYSEFLLSDGRRPLMRSSLSALETRLGAQGFLRTHRSWLVNPTRVTALRPEGSGDYAVALGEVEAPLSRRFPAALARLRG